MINQEIDLISFFNYDKDIINELLLFKHLDYIIVKNTGAQIALQNYRNEKKCSICGLTFSLHNKFNRNHVGSTHHTFQESTDILKYKIINTGFASPNKCKGDQTYDKNNLKFVHFAGKSPFKNTVHVVKAFIDKPDLGNLDVTCAHGVNAYCDSTLRYSGILTDTEYTNLINGVYPNIQYFTTRINDIDKYYKDGYIHICPSIAEGYGHYINDARQCGSIIITTDRYPMVELVTPESGVIIDTSTRQTEYIGFFGEKKANITSLDIQNAVERVKTLTQEELNKMSKKAKELNQKDTQYFRQTWNIFMTKVLNNQSSDDILKRYSTTNTYSNNYKQKYLKYKNKYLELKNLK